MSRFIYKSVIVKPTGENRLGYEALAGQLDRAMNTMTEDGWRLVQFTGPNANTGIYVFVFEKPANSPADFDR